MLSLTILNQTRPSFTFMVGAEMTFLWHCVDACTYRDHLCFGIMRKFRLLSADLNHQKLFRWNQFDLYDEVLWRAWAYFTDIDMALDIIVTTHCQVGHPPPFETRHEEETQERADHLLRGAPQRMHIDYYPSSLLQRSMYLTCHAWHESALNFVRLSYLYHLKFQGLTRCRNRLRSSFLITVNICSPIWLFLS